MTEIASALGRKTDVTVICGPEDYSGVKSECSPRHLSDLRIERVKSRNWDKNRLFSRLLRLIILSLKLTIAVYKRSKEGDRILMVTNPAPLLLLVSLVCTIKKLKLVVIVHDVFPENLTAAGIISKGHWATYILRALFNKGYSRAEQLIVLGRDMSDLMRTKVDVKLTKISIIPNWADIEGVYPVHRAQETGIRLQFAGNFGRVQGLIPLLECIHAASNPELIVDFVGNGAMERAMRTFCTNNGLTSVNILPRFNRSQQVRVLNNCDIAIVSLAEGMVGLGVPSKTYNILAAGKPILYIGDPGSEVFRLVQEEELGWCFPDYNAELVQFLQEINANMKEEIITKGHRARSVAVSKFSKKAVLNAYCETVLC